MDSHGAVEPAVERSARPLRPDERQALDNKLAWVRQRAGLPRAIFPALALLLVMAPCLAFAIPTWSGVALCALLFVVIGVGAGLGDRRGWRREIRRLEEAASWDRARVVRIRAEAVAEVEDVDGDAGPCFVFQLPEAQLLFLYELELDLDEGAPFPCAELELIDVLASDGKGVLSSTVVRGPRLEPVARHPAAFHREFLLPEHRTVLPGRLEHLEDALASRRWDLLGKDWESAGRDDPRV